MLERIVDREPCTTPGTIDDPAILNRIGGGDQLGHPLMPVMSRPTTSEGAEEIQTLCRSLRCRPCGV